MTNREIDILIAEKVMGWKLYHRYPEHNIVSYITFDDKRFYIGVSDTDPFKWHPTEDIGAAWQVVEKLTKDKKLTVEMVNHQNFNYGTYEFIIGGYAAVSQSAPLAICLAALMTIGINEVVK